MTILNNTFDHNGILGKAKTNRFMSQLVKDLKLVWLLQFRVCTQKETKFVDVRNGLFIA